MNSENYYEVLMRKQILFSEAINNTKVDLDSPEECIAAIEKNKCLFRELEVIDASFDDEIFRDHIEYIQMFKKVLELAKILKSNNDKLMFSLKKSKADTLNSMNQFSKIKSITSSYVKKESISIFVDKDFR
ncbi:hypothetical protein [Alkalibacter mobilis]|uniref:hypothetical protein n=1 Tax=Alkalibacter mobilis TaxID=2787712 RepID=UPI00189F9E38|nr:hypothetical protein [Alkalibacter mobilis]MBF7096328.1 hypothetical protein [Alkalibacter mobilis]